MSHEFVAVGLASGSDEVLSHTQSRLHAVELDIEISFRISSQLSPLSFPSTHQFLTSISGWFILPKSKFDSWNTGKWLLIGSKGFNERWNTRCIELSAVAEDMLDGCLHLYSLRHY